MLVNDWRPGLVRGETNGPPFCSTDDSSFPMTLVKVKKNRMNAVTSGDRFRLPNPRDSSTIPYLDLNMDRNAVRRSNSAEIILGIGLGVPNNVSSKLHGHISYMYAPSLLSNGGNPSPFGSTACTLFKSLCALAECRNGVSFFFNFNLLRFLLASMLWSKNLISGASAALCILRVTKSSNCCVIVNSSKKGWKSEEAAATNSSFWNRRSLNPSSLPARQEVRASRLAFSGRNLR
mmetsp:Transcript_3651/g.6585  ORF Transcript_3651/g.6585 Transcript_3651/m.6585 type:complete len:234 (-) Transcript_3651:2260-2961(-)